MFDDELRSDLCCRCPNEILVNEILSKLREDGLVKRDELKEVQLSAENFPNTYPYLKQLPPYMGSKVFKYFEDLYEAGANRYINPEDGIMLVRKEALIKGLKNLSINSDVILNEYWRIEKQIYSLISKTGSDGRSNFKKVKFSSLIDESYAVISYQWVKSWDEIIKYLTDPNNPVQDEWIWVDVICLDQNDKNKILTIKNSEIIYRNATEHHIVEVSSLGRGWVVYEISSIRRDKVRMFSYNHIYKVLLHKIFYQ